MSKKTLQFLRPVGSSVPGGPFVKGETYEVDDATLKPPLIKGLLSKGDIRVLGSLDEDAPKEAEKTLKKQLTAAKKRISELEEEVADLKAALQEGAQDDKPEEEDKNAPEQSTPKE